MTSVHNSDNESTARLYKTCATTHFTMHAHSLQPRTPNRFVLCLGSAYKRFPAGACVGWYQMHVSTRKNHRADDKRGTLTRDPNFVKSVFIEFAGLQDNTQKVYFSKMTQCNFAGCWSDRWVIANVQTLAVFIPVCCFSALCIYGLKTWACEATLSAVPAVNFASFSLSLDFCISPRLSMFVVCVACMYLCM